MEGTLAAIWAELLGLERVGRHDNFFELGGHSLLAGDVVPPAEALGVELRLAELFARPTLTDLAAASRRERPQRPAAAVAPRRGGCRCPSRSSGSGSWRSWRGASEAYHIAGGLRLIGALDRAALIGARSHRRAARGAAHALSPRGRRARATDRPARGFALARKTSRGADESALLRVAEEEAQAQFDLEEAPLIRGG